MTDRIPFYSSIKLQLSEVEIGIYVLIEKLRCSCMNCDPWHHNYDKHKSINKCTSHYLCFMHDHACLKISTSDVHFISLLEVGMLVILLIFLLVITNTKTKHIEKLFFAFSLFTVMLIILNRSGLFGTTIAAIVFVGEIVANLCVVLATINSYNIILNYNTYATLSCNNLKLQEMSTCFTQTDIISIFGIFYVAVILGIVFIVLTATGQASRKTIATACTGSWHADNCPFGYVLCS